MVDDCTAAAIRRVRAHVDAWVAESGETGVYPSLHLNGGTPLRFSDLKLVLEEAEGPHDHALIRLSGAFTEDGFYEYDVVRTFPGREAAEEAFANYTGPGQGLRIAFWDESDGTWRW